MILIYSKDVDDFVNEVIDYLNEDYSRIGTYDSMTIEEIGLNNLAKDFKIKTKYENIVNLDEIKSIWFNGGYARTNGSEYENECYEVLINSYLSQKQVYKIGRLRSNFEINKLDVAIEAKKHGFELPDTLLTSDKNQLIAFYDKHLTSNGIICKRITDRYIYQEGDTFYNFNLTFLIDSNILNSIPEKFALSLFQERIIPDFEIRVVFVNGEFYSMAIFTFDNDIDYRTKDMSGKNIRTVPYKLPLIIQEKLKGIFDSLDLNYGSVDLMYSNDTFYFLEINPTGQVSFLNNACNYYIEKKISELLKNEA